MYARDMRVVQPRLGLDFPLETTDLALSCKVAGQDFQCFVALRNPVFHLEDLAHTSGADDGDHPIVANVFANMQAHYFVLCKAGAWPKVILCYVEHLKRSREFVTSLASASPMTTCLTPVSL